MICNPLSRVKREYKYMKTWLLVPCDFQHSRAAIAKGIIRGGLPDPQRALPFGAAQWNKNVKPGDGRSFCYI